MGTPVGGARVRVDVGEHPVIPPHPFGPSSTNSSGRVTFRDGLPDFGWIRSRISVEPPVGSNLVGVVQQDSAHFGPLPAVPHVVQVTLPDEPD